MKVQAYNSLYSFLASPYRMQRTAQRTANIPTYAEKAITDFNSSKTAEQTFSLNCQRLKSFISG